MPGQVEGDHAEVFGHSVIAHKVAELSRVGSGGVEANQRNSLPGFFEINPAVFSHDGNPDIPPHDGFHGIRVHGAASFPRQGEEVFEILEVRHKGLEISLQGHLAPLGKREDVVPPRRGRVLPEGGPALRRTPHRKHPGAQQGQALVAFANAALFNPEQKGDGPDLNQTIGREIPTLARPDADPSSLDPERPAQSGHRALLPAPWINPLNTPALLFSPLGCHSAS